MTLMPSSAPNKHLSQRSNVTCLHSDSGVNVANLTLVGGAYPATADLFIIKYESYFSRLV